MIIRVLKNNVADDLFNEKNETFLQEEKRIENKYSINLPTLYQFKKNKEKSLDQYNQPPSEQWSY
ncbi:MAG: hypothetical protein ACMUEM_07235 [Flavobacteriales bacterium AspAUS03]